MLAHKCAIIYATHFLIHCLYVIQSLKDFSFAYDLIRW